MDDKRIVALFLSRDEAAIAQTREKYGGRLQALAFGITKSRMTAEECENDTYLEAWNRIPPQRPADYLYAFLACITRHIALNCCRSQNRLKRRAYLCELDAEMEQCLPAPDDTECRVEAAILAQVINDFLAGLTEEKRNIFLRRYWFLDSVAAISDRFGISESKVKTMLFRIRSELKAYLEKEGYVL